MRSLLIAACFFICYSGTASSGIPTHWGSLSCRGYLEVLKDLAERNEETANQLAWVWLHGFVAGSRGETTMDPAVFARYSTDVFDACLDNLDAPVLDIARRVPFTSGTEDDTE